MQTSWLESLAFASTKSCTLVAKIFHLRLELLKILRFYKFRIRKKIGIWSFQASSLCLFKNSYSWRKVRSRWNVSGKEAYCSLVITFYAVIVPSKSRISCRRYLFCLYWRLPWSISTWRYRVCLDLCKLHLLFPKNSWATLFSPDSISSSFILLCFLPLLSLI